MRRVGPLAQRDRLFEVAGEPRGLGEVLEVFRTEPAVVRAAEGLVRVAPSVAPRGFPAAFERVADDLSHGVTRLYVRAIEMMELRRSPGRVIVTSEARPPNFSPHLTLR